MHQWAKNALLLVPALAAHRPPEPDTVLALTVAVASFSLLASAVYLLNDLVDLEHDRAHPVKRNRPLAAGEVSPVAAVSVLAVFAVTSLALALTLPRAFLAAWLSYLVVTTAYSFALKRIVVLDVLVLAALYTLRVLAGAAALSVPLSRWFLAFSVFVFTSLALLKRLVEAQSAAGRDRERVRGRGWRVGDEPVLVGLGTASAVAAALVYCLYITGPDVVELYAHPDVLWLGLPVLLYWLARIWLFAHRGEVHDDPLVFALTDRASYVVLGALILTVGLAI